MNCPRDHTPLIDQSRSGTAFQRCPSCDGVWLPLPAKSPLVNELRQLPTSPSTVSTARPHHPPVACPLHANEQMAQHYLHGIQLDICPQGDGLWLDAGERPYVQAWQEKFANQPGVVIETTGKVATIGSGIDVIGSILSAIFFAL